LIFSFLADAEPVLSSMMKRPEIAKSFCEETVGAVRRSCHLCACVVRSCSFCDLICSSNLCVRNRKLLLNVR